MANDSANCHIIFLGNDLKIPYHIPIHYEAGWIFYLDIFKWDQWLIFAKKVLSVGNVSNYWPIIIFIYHYNVISKLTFQTPWVVCRYSAALHYGQCTKSNGLKRLLGLSNHFQPIDTRSDKIQTLRPRHTMHFLLNFKTCFHIIAFKHFFTIFVTGWLCKTHKLETYLQVHRIACSNFLEPNRLLIIGRTVIIKYLPRAFSLIALTSSLPRYTFIMARSCYMVLFVLNTAW